MSEDKSRFNRQAENREALRTRISQVIEATDIVELIDQLVDGGLRKQGSGYIGLCPFHSDTNPSLSVNAEKSVYRCWSCDAGMNGSSGGNAVTFVRRYFNKDFMEACEMLAQRLGIQLRDQDPRYQSLNRNDAFASNPELMQKLKERREARRLADKAPEYESTDAQQIEVLIQAENAYRNSYLHNDDAREYLSIKRGISEVTADRFKIGYAPEGYGFLADVVSDYSCKNKALLEAGLVKVSAKNPEHIYDTFRNRLLFTVRNANGDPVGFGGRLIKDESFTDANGNEVKLPKYLNSPESAVFKKSELLFGWYENRAEINASKQVVVVEGYMDVVGLANKGVYNAVACMGVALSQSHVQKISGIANQLVVCFDGDRAGRSAATRSLIGILPAIKEHVDVRFLLLPDGLDPDEFVSRYGKEVFDQLISRSQGLSEFMSTVVNDIAIDNKDLPVDEIKERQFSMIKHWQTISANNDAVLTLISGKEQELIDLYEPKTTKTEPDPLVVSPPSTQKANAPMSQAVTGGFNPYGSNTPKPTNQPTVGTNRLERSSTPAIAQKKGLTVEARILDAVEKAPRSAYQSIEAIRKAGEGITDPDIQVCYEAWLQWFSYEARESLKVNGLGDECEQSAGFFAALPKVFELSSKRGLRPVDSSENKADTIAPFMSNKG